MLGEVEGKANYGSRRLAVWHVSENRRRENWVWA